MKNVNWWIVGIVAIIVILFLFGGGMMSGYGYRDYGMMGGPGMGIGMLFMWLIPVGILALIVFGVASLVRNNGNPTPSNFQGTCPHCGKGTQAIWQNCPYCGTTLK